MIHAVECQHEHISYDRDEQTAECARCGEAVPLWRLVEKLMESEKVVKMHRPPGCPCPPLVELMGAGPERVTILRMR